VVESCVNRVGVDVNSASYKLLAYVAGIGEGLAKGIVAHRFEHGAFKRREQLLEVSRFGAKAFQQAAGFLRIREGEDPLDASAVHPESYPVVQRICQLAGKTVPELIGNEAVLSALDPKLLVDDQFGIETVKDILDELRKPGRDPRQHYEAVTFREGVNKPSDLEPGMELQGIVTNVTDFGAFVDVGVHQDGLVHLSEIAHRYVKNPADALSVGQAVKVKVLAVDLEAKRIALSIKALLPAPEGGAQPQPRHQRRGAGRPEGGQPRPPRPEGARPQGPRPPRPEGARPPRPEGPRPPRPEGPRPPRPEGSRPPRPEGPRPPRPEGRPARPEGARPPRPQEARPPRPERVVLPPEPTGPVVPASSDSISELMARFNKGHR